MKICAKKDGEVWRAELHDNREGADTVVTVAYGKTKREAIEMLESNVLDSVAMVEKGLKNLGVEVDRTIQLDKEMEEFIERQLGRITNEAMRRRATKAADFYRQAVKTGGGIMHDPDAFRVNGYNVDLAAKSCDCKDFRHNSQVVGPCYHIYAARLMQRRERLFDGTPLPQNGM